MPVSHPLQISRILALILKLNPRSILDVGCGLGIYGALSRIYLEGDNLYDRENLTWNKKENWEKRIDCIEGFDRYITDLHRFIYNEIFISEAMESLSSLRDRSYDLVMAVDILEHFEKEKGPAFIKELKRIGKNVIIATPSEPEEQIVPENPLENHRSCWSREELESFGFRIVKEIPSLIGLYTFQGAKSPEVLSGEITARMYKEGDESGIVKLFKEVFGREMSLDEWKWKYLGRGNKKVYSSVAVDSEGRVVAHYGGMFHPMILEGEEVYGLAIGDVMVHSKLRSLKLFKKVASILPVESSKDGVSVGYGFPNERAMRLPENLGLYEKIEDVMEGDKEVEFHNDLDRYRYKLFSLHYSDNRIDRLWETCKRDIHLSVIRDMKYFKWRYRDHPLFNYELWGMKSRFGRKLLGVAVLKREDYRVLIMDFLCEKGMFKPIIKKIENYAFTIGKKKISLWAPPFMEKLLVESGFSVKPAGTCIPISTHEKFKTKEEMKDKFYYTMGDTDFL